MSAKGKHHVDWLALADAKGTSPTMRAAILAAAGSDARRPAAPSESASVATAAAGQTHRDDGAAGKKKKAKTRMPQAKKVSKTEEEYGRLLAKEFPAAAGYKIRGQSVTLRFESGVRYTPDFTVWLKKTMVTAAEVKGGYRLHSAADSRTKFLTASVEWPDVEWRHAQKIEGEWIVQKLNKNPTP